MIFNQVLPAAISGSVNFGSFAKTLIWGLIIIICVTAIGILVKNKIKYQYYGVVFKRRQNDPLSGLPQSSMLQGKAGYFRKRSGKTVYRIKYGVAPWMKIETSKLPDPEYMIGNCAYYQQIQKDNYVQCHVGVDWKMGEIKISPVDDDTKFAARLEMEENRNILTVRSMSPVTVGMIVMGLIIVAGIVVFYFLSRAGGAGG